MARPPKSEHFYKTTQEQRYDNSELILRTGLTGIKKRNPREKLFYKNTSSVLRRKKTQIKI